MTAEGHTEPHTGVAEGIHTQGIEVAGTLARGGPWAVCQDSRNSPASTTRPSAAQQGRKSVTLDVAKLVHETVENAFDSASESDTDSIVTDTSSTGANADLEEDTLLV